ncbi:uncharacterized protein EAF01_011282 [Botrytis porri]|uniref:Uncharacterized protein n=1 Tax=Botrytis porri TaxID=87229 RepID=A0A4Z1KJQ1_9HELO|nr:uncharacterized protein EAF01_011282 [Botrytis porri]KAF7886604.1 hypothetical protein EAF01_011282 [Botrytis porri]TGO86287.1 hypothetical protein BPOR_0316g00050 [Botrytis porri]
MARVRAKTTMKRTPLPDQRMATTKEPTIKSSNSKSTAEPRKFKMSAASRRIFSISQQTVVSRLKAQVKKDSNKKSTSTRTTVESLGKKSQKGREHPWLELPKPEDLLYQDEKNVEYYTHYYNYYAPLQDLKKKENMTWNAILAIHAEHFPGRKVPPSTNALSDRACTYYHKLCVILEAEKEAVALAEDTENPEFVFPDEEDDEDEDDEHNERALEGQAK